MNAKSVVTAPPSRRAERRERLGIVSFTNVAPLHWDLAPDRGAQPGSALVGSAPASREAARTVDAEDRAEIEFVYGVPTELNAALERGDIDLTLVSSIEFVRHRDRYKALLDFSIATLGPVYSVMLFHRPEWGDLAGTRLAVTQQSSTSVELLRQLLAASGQEAELVPTAGDLDDMLAEADGALLIGDAALRAAVAHLRPSGDGPAARGMSGRSVLEPELRVSDLGESWYRLTRLPFTFAVWASHDDNPPSAALIERFRSSRTAGLGRLGEVAAVEARRLGLPAKVVQRYLENFRYYLEPPDMDGLNEFASRSDPEFAVGQLRFWDG